MSATIKVKIEQASAAGFRRITTRTGRPMVRFRAEIGKDRLAVVAFNTLAERLDLHDGDQVNVIGRLEGTNWTAADGSNRYGWQVVANQVDQAGQPDQAPAPAPAPPPPAPPRSPSRQGRQVRMFNGADPGPFDYEGGPF